MGNKFHRKKKKKIKNAGDEFILEDYEIYDSTNYNRQTSIIHFDPNLIVFEVKSQPYEDYKVIKNLGEGTFGKVDLVEHKITGKIRAMKIIKKTNVINPNISNEASILNELNILKKIDHQNVVKIYEYYSDKENYYLVTEYCAGGDLYAVMKNEPISEVQAACIMYQILVALNHIHKMKIMHRDLKLENILVSKKEEDGLYRVKICDFGTSHLFKNGKKEKLIAGSSYYMAPEVLKRKYDFKCDLWSCGVIMYVLLTKKVPFFGANEKQMRKSIIKKSYNPEPLQIYSQYVQNIIDELLEKDYEKRLNAEKALACEIFTVYKCKETINQISMDEIKLYIENIKKYKKSNIFQETAISYLIHNCDLDEISGILKFFNKLDKEEKGKIDLNEFLNGLCEVTGEIFDQDEVKDIFYNIDTNKNNYIEQEEFVKAAIDKKIFLSEKMMKSAFNFFDLDKSGLITIEDITELFKENIKDDTKANEELKKIIQSVDKDSDGKIDLEEFSIFMKTILEKL